MYAGTLKPGAMSNRLFGAEGSAGPAPLRAPVEPLAFSCLFSELLEWEIMSAAESRRVGSGFLTRGVGHCGEAPARLTKDGYEARAYGTVSCGRCLFSGDRPKF